MQLQSFNFQGQPLPLIHIDGQPAWLARDVGRVLSYSSDGGALVRNMTQRWADELLEGHDYDVLSGAELNALREVVSKMDTTLQTSDKPLLNPFAPSVTVLYQSGLNLVCLLSKKPLGRALRRWLADEVLPALAKGEGIPGAAAGDDQRLKDLRALASLQLKAGLKKDAQRTVKLAAHLTAPDFFSYHEAKAMVPMGPPRYVLEALAEAGVDQPGMTSPEWFMKCGGRLLGKEHGKASRGASVAMAKLLSACEDVEFKYRGRSLVIQRVALRDERKRPKIGWRVNSAVEGSTAYLI